MIVDTSALVAILRDEPDAPVYAAALAEAGSARLSAANYLETAIVIDASRDPIASRHVDDLIQVADLTVEPVTAEQVVLARAAYRDFGRGSGHRSRLNFGDCFAYALARATGEPLLYKGDDFGHTDVEPAVVARS